MTENFEQMESKLMEQRFMERYDEIIQILYLIKNTLQFYMCSFLIILIIILLFLLVNK